MSVKNITVDHDNEGRRVDNFLFSNFKNIPKSKIYKVIRKGEVRVNSKRVKQIQLLEKYLAQLDLVSNFYITSFNNNNTIYKIIFNGNPNQFLNLMKEKDIDIDTNQEIWKVR